LLTKHGITTTLCTDIHTQRKLPTPEAKSTICLLHTSKHEILSVEASMDNKGSKQKPASLGGRARAEALSSAERKQIAEQAARARWAKNQEDSEEPCVTSVSTKDRSYWLNRPYIPADIRAQLEKADILLVPYEGFREQADPLFPVGTEEVFQYLREHADNFKVDICITDADYKELALHSDLLRLPELLINGVIVASVVNLLTSYIYDKFKSRKGGEVKARFLVQKADGQTVQIEYNGPAETFSAAMNNAVKSLTSDVPRSTENSPGPLLSDGRKNDSP
jgi:hypothetical protein